MGRQEALKKAMELLESGFEEFLRGDEERYKMFLKISSRFYRYSLRNQLLIALQMPDASYVASFSTWNRIGRTIKKGSKGIAILCPAPVKVKSEEKETVEEEEDVRLFFKIGYVFDVSQTAGKDLPILNAPDLTGTVDGYHALINDLISIAPVPVVFEKISGLTKGYYRFVAPKIIAIQEGMPELQTVKTLCHEIGHAMADHLGLDTAGSRDDKELIAESSAFVICNYLGLDTSAYSFPYLTSWSSNHNVKDLKKLLETIRRVSSTVIEGLDKG